MSTTFQAYIDQHDLDISIVEKKNLGLFDRIDAEFYRPEFLEAKKILSSKNLHELGSVSIVTDGEHGSPDLDENGFICLSGNNINSGNIVIDESTKKITKQQFEKNKRVLVKEGNILVSIVGTVGNVAVATESIEAVTDRNVATIKGLDTSYVPDFLYAFLLGKYGQSQLMRYCTGNVQPLLNLTQVRTVSIPKSSPEFQKKTKQLVDECRKKKSLSKSLYAQAEQLLLDELGLSDRTPSEENIATHMSEDVKLFGRCDAEFFQPKYDEIEAILSKNKTFELGKIATIIKGKNIKYNEDGKTVVLKTKQLKNDYIDFEGSDSNSDEGELLLDNDIVFASMGVGSLGKTDIFYSKYYPGKYTIDSTIYVFRDMSVINPEYLLVLFRTKFFQEYIYRFVVGSSGIINILANNIKSLKIPTIGTAQMEKIQSLIIQSHQARNESNQLLETAQTAVEIFIEEDEDKAMEWISNSQNK